MTTTPGPSRVSIPETLERLKTDPAHAEARLYRWYLVVQRESLGLFRHDDLDALYPVPDLPSE